MTAKDDAIERDLIAFVAKALNVEPSMLSTDSAVGDVPGWDSFAQVNLLMKIEEHYEIAFEPDDLLSMETLGDIVSSVQRLAGSTV